MRINRYLSRCGAGSRRAVENLIREGRVEIDGHTVRDLSRIVSPGEEVRCDGELLRLPESTITLMLHKPAGYITTLNDEMDRPKITDLIPNEWQHAKLFPVGRLDRDTTGLLLLTNDGDLAHHLTHPRFKVVKTYIASLDRECGSDALNRLARGIYIPQLDFHTSPARVRPLDDEGKNIEIKISEGKKRQVRYSFQALGCTVTALHRSHYGPLELGLLKEGECRPLTPRELEDLHRSVSEGN